jgi:hypothetical protein
MFGTEVFNFQRSFTVSLAHVRIVAQNFLTHCAYRQLYACDSGVSFSLEQARNYEATQLY